MGGVKTIDMRAHFLCLRPSMCSYDGELFNLNFSVHDLFPSHRDSGLYLPLYD